MNDAAFSKSEAFRFGWETAKGNIGFFIWVILAGYVLPTAINVAASGLFERHLFFGAVLWLASTLLGCILMMGILRIGLKFTLWLQKIGSFNGTDCHIVTCGASEDRVSMLLTETRSNPLQEDTASEVQQTSCFGPFSQAP